MRGRRHGRFQHNRRERTRSSRRQGESHWSDSRVGMTPEVGAYLDLPPGQAVDPVHVLNWLDCLKLYMDTNFESRIRKIIGEDGVLREYPKIEAPEDPDADAGVVEIMLWEFAFELYRKEIESLKREKCKLYGVMLGQMSKGSRNRIEQSSAGKKAVKEIDPLGLLSVVIATHISNNRYGETYDMITADSNFSAIRMRVDEDLVTYCFSSSQRPTVWRTLKCRNTATNIWL
jgi:hypothetical protein